MSTVKTLQIASTSSNHTEAIAEAVGSQLRGGEVIELISDLGGGKTCFVRGLANGIGSNDHVASPTFTISRQYVAKKLRMYHFDFYRLQEAGIMTEELSEAIEDPAGIAVIEWGAVVADAIPVNHMTISIERTGDDSRKISFSCPESLGYLLATLTA